MKTLILSLFFGISLSLCAYNDLNNYLVSGDYSINFKTTKAEGSFTGLSGEVKFSDEDIENAYVNVKVDVATIRTGNTTKDKHAKKSKWFDVKKYPYISFVSESIRKTNKQYQLTGTLTIKDVSQQHVIDFHLEKYNEENYLIGTTIIDRNQFNIEGNMIGFLVGDEVQVELRIPANFIVHT